MKKIYQKPEAILVSFQAEDELMSGPSTGTGGTSFGGGGGSSVAPFAEVDTGWIAEQGDF